MNEHRLFRGAWALTLGGVASFALSFLRNLILARLLSKADFGVAALFASALAMLESASRVPFGQQVVQAPAGDSRRFRDTAHTFQVGMAVFGALLLAVLAAVGAGFFAKLDATWAIWALALVPIARGLENLDMFREQRRFNQTPGVLCEFVPQLVVTLAAWPLVLWLRDYRAVLCILVAKPVLGTIMTHLVAYEPYGLAWHRGYLRSMVKFGWPLQLNGLLMFASQQADQFLVAGFLSKEALASYALAFALVNVPWAIFVQPAASLMLSVLSRVQDDSDRFRAHYRFGVEVAAAGALLLTVPLILFGEQLVTLLYGGKYAGSGKLVAVLGMTTAVRFLRFAPAVASIARADTGNQLYSNLVRAASLPLAAVAASLGGGAVSIAGAALIAELAAGSFSMHRLERRQGVPLADSRLASGCVLAFLAIAAALVWLGSARWSMGVAGLVLLAVFSSIAVVARLLFPATMIRLAQVGVASLKRRPG